MTQYQRGRAKEWAVCKRLRENGYEAIRSAGSHGLFDVVGVSDLDAVLIQVKYTRLRGAVPKDENWEKFEVLDVPGNVHKYVYVYRYGNAVPEVIKL